MKMSTKHTDAPALLGIVVLGVSLLPGFFTVVIFAHIIHLLRFWRHPTVFDYATGALRCGGRDVCRLNDIRQVCLKLITDPNYPQKAEMGLAVVLKDGSWQLLEPYSRFLSFLNRLNKRLWYTDLGMLQMEYQRELAYGAAREVAQRIDVPLKVHKQLGNFTPRSSK